MSNSNDNQPVQVEIIEKGDDWPEGISDGLTIPCRVCGKMPLFDYHIDDNLWSVLIPSRFRQSVVCLPCLDALGKEKGVHVGEYLRFMQFTGWNHTVVLSPSVAYRFAKRDADTYTIPGKADHESSDGKSTAEALAEVDMNEVNDAAIIRQQADHIQRLEANLAERDRVNKRLRGQLQNCVNHLDCEKQRGRRDHLDQAIESANRALYETQENSNV